MLMLGLGHTTGNTFLAKSATGRKEGRGNFKDIFIYNINIIFFEYFFWCVENPDRVFGRIRAEDC
jgi:hypothetical protein